MCGFALVAPQGAPARKPGHQRCSFGLDTHTSVVRSALTSGPPGTGIAM